MRKSGMQKAKGKIKEVMGRATGDKRMEAEGRGDRMAGKVREVGQKVRETGEKARHAMRRRAS
ncbi:CsbD family protein [Streptomyces sp. NPDC055103]